MTAQALADSLRRPRHRTRPFKMGGKTRRTPQRACNGCGRPLGDATQVELDATARHLNPPDVRPECPTCTPNPAGLEWTLELPWTRPPLTLNDRGTKPVVRNHVVRTVRRNAHAHAHLARIPPLHRLAAELHYAPRGSRTRDPLNLVATLKAIEDGLVDANLVPDDDPTYVEPTMPVIDEPTKRKVGRMYLVIRELHTSLGATSCAPSL